MAKMEVSPQNEMASPQSMKVFVIDRHGLPEEFVYFRDLCGVQSLPLVIARIVRLGVIRSRETLFFMSALS